MTVAELRTKSIRPTIVLGRPFKLVEINYGLVVVVFNASTHYITISSNGSFVENVIGTKHASIDSLFYEDGALWISSVYDVQIGMVVYTPNGIIVA